MNLLEIRTKLVELTGRWDLVLDAGADDYTDDGADFFIQEAQRYLDRKFRFPKESADVEVTLAAGETVVYVPNARAIKRVRIDDNYIERVSYQALIDRYGVPPFTSAERAVPTHFAPTVVRGGTPTLATEGQQALIFAAPPAVDTTIVVEGLVFSNELSEDDDVSYWSIVEPFLLVQASAMKMEEMYRNRAGVMDFKVAVEEKVRDIDFDQVEAMLVEPLQMKNTW